MSVRAQILRATRDAMLTGAAMLGLAACAPEDGPVAPRVALADGAGGSARVITSVQVLQPGALVASVGYADTATAPVLVTDGSAGVDLNTVLGKPIRPSNPGDERLWSASRASGAAILEVARDDRRPSRQGRWTRRARLADGRSAEVELVARDGAPISEVTVRVEGEIVSTELRRWARVAGAWHLAARTTTAYRGGRAVGWMETVVELPTLPTQSAGARAKALGLAVVRDGARVVADALAPSALYAQAMTGPCGTQANNALDALDDFLLADFAFGAALLSGNPMATFAAAGNLVRAERKVDVTQERLDDCVARA